MFNFKKNFSKLLDKMFGEKKYFADIYETMSYDCKPIKVGRIGFRSKKAYEHCLERVHMSDYSATTYQPSEQ